MDGLPLVGVRVSLTVESPSAGVAAAVSSSLLCALFSSTWCLRLAPYETSSKFGEIDCRKRSVKGPANSAMSMLCALSSARHTIAAMR